MPKISVRAVPIMENEHVKEFLSILRENNAPTMKDMLAMLGQVTAMEKQLETMVTELQGMRRDLAEAERRNHPLRNTLQKAVIVMQAQVLELRDKLSALKQNIINGCKNAVAAFKEKGIAALDNIARFFKVRPMLEAIHTGADKAAGAADRAVANIEAASARYHEAGRNLKNAGRALSGREAIAEAKSNGKISKVFTAPYRAVRSSFSGISKSAAAAVGRLTRLEERGKPSIKKEMEDLNKKIAERERAAPKRDRPVPSAEL